jgi:hypothetical protein
MRLADYILSNMEAILVEWELFAGTQLPAAARMSPLALRDHARQILEGVATDLMTPQTEQAQVAKSMGRVHAQIGAPQTAAQTHAVLRAQRGFDINQLAAEYRALRASVLRLWIEDCHPERPDLDDLIRFNEAIDQAVAESLAFFGEQVEQARNLLLGMIGHDLRSPLQAIQMTAAYLAALNSGDAVSKAASRLINSGARIQALLDDLVDLNRTKLGLGIHISRSEADLAIVIGDALDQLRAAYPERRLMLEVDGDTRGFFDGERLTQVLDNLVVNAIKYGAADAPIRIVLIGEKADVRMEVTNLGLAIGEGVLATMFDPLTRGAGHQSQQSARESLGLGLYIVREIVNAHGGEINARSEGNETVLALRVPRRQ